MTTSTKPTETADAVKADVTVATFTQAEIDAHLAKIVAAATKRHERAPRRASARVVNGKIRCALDFTARDFN